MHRWYWCNLFLFFRSVATGVLIKLVFEKQPPVAAVAVPRVECEELWHTFFPGIWRPQLKQGTWKAVCAPDAISPVSLSGPLLGLCENIQIGVKRVDFC